MEVGGDVTPEPPERQAGIRARSPLTVRLLELLADGEWHPREPIIVELSKLLLPGAAWRVAERARAQTSRQANDGVAKERERARSDSFLVASGRRREALMVINRTKRVQRRRNEDGTTDIRLRPPMKLGPAKGSRFIDGKYVPPSEETTGEATA